MDSPSNAVNMYIDVFFLLMFFSASDIIINFTKNSEINWKYSKHLVSGKCFLLSTKVTNKINENSYIRKWKETKNK